MEANWEIFEFSIQFSVKIIFSSTIEHYCHDSSTGPVRWFKNIYFLSFICTLYLSLLFLSFLLDIICVDFTFELNMYSWLNWLKYSERFSHANNTFSIFRCELVVNELLPHIKPCCLMLPEFISLFRYIQWLCCIGIYKFKNKVYAFDDLRETNSQE